MNNAAFSMSAALAAGRKKVSGLDSLDDALSGLPDKSNGATKLFLPFRLANDTTSNFIPSFNVKDIIAYIKHSCETGSLTHLMNDVSLETVKRSYPEGLNKDLVRYYLAVELSKIKGDAAITARDVESLKNRLLIFGSMVSRKKLAQKLRELSPEKYPEEVQPSHRQKQARGELILDMIDGYYVTYMNALNEVNLLINQESGPFQGFGYVRDEAYCNAFREEAVRRKCMAYLEHYGLTIRRFNHMLYEYQRDVVSLNKADVAADDAQGMFSAAKVGQLLIGAAKAKVMYVCCM